MATRKRMTGVQEREAYRLAVEQILVTLYGKTEHEAESLVSGWWGRLVGTSVFSSGFFMHDEPINAAAKLIGVPARRIDGEISSTYRQILVSSQKLAKRSRPVALNQSAVGFDVSCLPKEEARSGISLVDQKVKSLDDRRRQARSLLHNAITGVSTGWTKDLDIVGIGYRAELKGKNVLLFTAGSSDTIEFSLPAGIKVTIDPKQTHLTISGIDRQKVGQVAAKMRSLRKADPYEIQVVRYTGDKLKKQVGKTGNQ